MERIFFRDLRIVKSTKLRNFQFKLLHRKDATNSFLHKTGIKDSIIYALFVKKNPKH